MGMIEIAYIHLVVFFVAVGVFYLCKEIGLFNGNKIER